MLYRPQFESRTYPLWLGLFLLLVVVLVVVTRRLRAAAKPIDVDEGALASARQLLEEGASASEKHEPGKSARADTEESDK